jgi:hypothetical protein
MKLGGSSVWTNARAVLSHGGLGVSSALPEMHVGSAGLLMSPRLASKLNVIVVPTSAAVIVRSLS